MCPEGWPEDTRTGPTGCVHVCCVCVRDAVGIAPGSEGMGHVQRFAEGQKDEMLPTDDTGRREDRGGAGKTVVSPTGQGHRDKERENLVQGRCGCHDPVIIYGNFFAFLLTVCFYSETQKIVRYGIFPGKF